MAYNILIVDDSSVVRKVLIKTFGMTNISVGNFYQAENGKVGLDVLKTNWIDLIFLDINMPVMNGMEFMEKISQDPDHKTTPVIVVSTEGSQERRDALQSAGVKDYLRKPVTPEALIESINRVLGGVGHE